MKPAFVVLTDLLPSSEAAISYTTRLAKLVDGRMVLLHVYLDPLLEPEVAMVSAPVLVASRQEILSGIVHRANQLPVPGEAELTVDTLEAAVADVVERHRPLLLAVGREQLRSAFDRLITNLALPVLHDAYYPLLVVPDNWKEPAQPSRVVVAADGHSFWLTAPSLALAPLLAALDPHTTVVHVAGAHGPSHADVGMESVRRTGLFGPLTGNSLYEVREEAPADGILHAAAETDAQLIVVMARPHTFIGGLFHHSVTAEVMRRSRVPVLVLPTMP